MRTLTSGTLTVQAYDANVWLQERNVLRIKDTGATKVSIGTSPSSFFATYTLDANKEAVVDVSDYMRTHASAENLIVRTDGGATQYVNANYIPVGLINPKNVIIPGTISGWPMEPPTMHAQLFSGSSFGLRVELCASENASVMSYRGELGRVWQLSAWVPQVITGTGLTEIVINRDYKYMIKELNPCARYVAVRWVSFTGETRLHTLELRDANQAADEVIKLETLDGSYNQIKGRTDGFKLYLDDLSAYDVWYYSDIITSSKVEVSLDGETWVKVEVTTKSVTLPNTDQGNNNKIEIAVNWRNYDAVTM